MDKAPVNVPLGHEAMANAPRPPGDGLPSGTASPGEDNTPPQRSITPSSPPTIPDYELLCRIGGGAYGEVWLARSATGVLRALKIVWRHTFEDDRPFQREFEGIQCFERISREHPSQLALFHVGRGDGYFYYVMELADTADRSNGVMESWSDGTKAEAQHSNTPTLQHTTSYAPHTLRADLAHGRLPAARVLELGLALTEALAHLHENGLVHRDIKPSNIIFANGRPKLADIGLVTDAGDARSIVGTEGYLAPEGPGTPQADLFALGKVLYEAVTGIDRREFPKLPPSLREWSDAGLVFELNEILLRACGKEAATRYHTAEEMRDDLTLLQRGESVLRTHQSEKRWRFVRRAAGGLAVAAGVVALTVYASRSWQPEPTDYEGKDSPIPEAKHLFDLGQHAYEKKLRSDDRLAMHYFEAAVRADPNFAKAYAWLAASQCWSFAGTNRNYEFLPQARLTAEHALALDRRLAKAHLALAWCAYHTDWNWRKAEEHFRLARKYAPRDPEIYEWRALLLVTLGRTQEAIDSLNTALSFRSDSISAKHFLGGALAAARRYDEAIAELKTIIEMEEAGPLIAYSTLAETLINAGRFEEGIKATRIADIRDRGIDEQKANEAACLKLAAYHTNGSQGYWQLLLKWEEADSSGPDPYKRAVLHARLDRTNEALRWLEEAERNHDDTLFFQIKREPAFDSLRHSPRFKTVVKKLGLPE